MKHWVLFCGLLFVALMLKPAGAQEVPPPLEGADQEIIAILQIPDSHPLPLARGFISNASAFIQPSLSITELTIDPLPLSRGFIANATAFLTNALVKPPLAPVVSSEELLAEKFLPILYFHEDEKYRPQEVQVVFDTADLYQGDDIVPDAPNPLTPEFLADKTDNDYKLDLTGDEFHEGYENTTYAHIVEDEGHIVLQYWFFYYFNDWEGSITDPVEDFQHEGDWEMIQLVFPKDKSIQEIVESNISPESAVYSAHAGGYKEDWSAVEKDENRPIVYVAKGSHANHFQPGFCDLPVPLVFTPSNTDEARADESFTNLISSQPILDPIENTQFNWLLFGGKWGQQNNSPASPWRQELLGKSKWNNPFEWVTSSATQFHIVSWASFYDDRCDGDFDGIWNNADPQPTTPSNDFDAPGFLKNTSGTITNRGDRDIKVKDAEAGGVHITSNFGTKRATIKFDTFKCVVVGTLPVVGPFLFIPPFTPFAGIATCGSTEVSTEEGTAELQITVGALEVLGTVNAGQTIKYSIVDDKLQIETSGEGEIPLFINGELITIQAGETYSVLEISMDIKPTINCTAQNSIIPVAIPTTETFDATMIDPATVLFEGAPETHNKLHQESTDIIVHFRLGDTTLTCDSTEATLTGKTTDSTIFIATDSIDTAPN